MRTRRREKPADRQEQRHRWGNGRHDDRGGDEVGGDEYELAGHPIAQIAGCSEKSLPTTSHTSAGAPVSER